jgi:hypothetical protein
MTRSQASGRGPQILADVLTGADEGEDIPKRMLAACTRALPVTGAGLALMTERGPGGMLAATDGPAALLEHLQFTLGEGPCVDSARTGRPVHSDDLERSGKSLWPRFTSGALDAGVRAVFAFPLGVAQIRIGVLDLYRDTPGPLPEPALDDAESYADATTLLLLHLHAERPLGDAATRWADGLADSSAVHQATGMVSVQSNVSLEDALLVLRARAFASERTLDAVARDVVDRVIRIAADRGEE